MRRVSVVGSSGSGKTTFARRLAAKLQVPHIELDALCWDPNWTYVDDATFLGRVDAATSADAWVADGNYTRARSIVLSRADTVVWLDLPFATCLARILRRTAQGLVKREPLWSGNRDSWRRQLSRHSLVWWLITSYRRRRKEFDARFFGRPPEFAQLRVYRFRRTAEAEAWLESLAQLVDPSGPGIELTAQRCQRRVVREGDIERMTVDRP